MIASEYVQMRKIRGRDQGSRSFPDPHNGRDMEGEEQENNITETITKYFKTQ
jgi:hypothetical protein